MASDGKVVFQIEGDARGVKNTIKDVTADIEKESKKWDNAVKESSDDMTKSFAKAFDIERLKNWGIKAAEAIGKFIGEAISAASDLAEVQNVVDVTFGDSARQIDAWAKSAGASYGLTETQAKRYASTIGAMIKSQGIAQSEVLGMSETLAGLAADMASFYNLDFDTAFEKLRSGISGETEPLKQLGINMSAANLEAFALEQGITKSYSAMSQGEQTMLRYQYIMKATADAQGDFARTSDGFANATRRAQASIETIKTKGGALLMTVIEPLTSGLANFLDKLTEEPERTVLDDFADIDKEYSEKMDRMLAQYDMANDLLVVMDKIQAKTATLNNGKTVSFENLFGDLDKVKKDGGDIREYLNTLGVDANEIAQEYDVWRDSLSRITQAVPALTSVIDAQTGAIDGGTDAIKTNLEEWKKAEEQKYLLTAYYAKLSALEEKRGQLHSYQLDMLAAEERHTRELNKRLESEYASSFVLDANGDIDYVKSHNKLIQDYNGKPPSEAQGLLNTYFGYGKGKQAEEASPYGAYKKAVEEYTRQVEAFGTAEEMMEDLHAAMVKLYGEDAVAAFAAGQAAEEGAEQTTKALAKTRTATIDAVKALKDYMESVRDSTESAVNSIVKGFDTIERPTTDLLEKRSKLIEQQNELNRSTKDGEKKYQELQQQIDDLNKSIDEYSPKGMKDALESQLAFMQEYTANLEKARSMGLSNELLASLSDGSVQSAEYLAALVQSPEMAKEIDDLYGQVQEQKKGFTDALTEQKLAADEVYNGLVEDAHDAVGKLFMHDEAQDAMSNTVDGLIDGLNSRKGELESTVDAIVAIVSTLNSVYNFPIVSGVFGGPVLDGSHETGLDYVPFDNYLASLHEGEGILTAEENRIWQRFKNGAQPQTMDYDALGATMRENVQAGGNVYLDGRAVGQVISQAQGNSYRSLQRSGFQA